MTSQIRKVAAKLSAPIVKKAPVPKTTAPSRPAFGRDELSTGQGSALRRNAARLLPKVENLAVSAKTAMTAQLASGGACVLSPADRKKANEILDRSTDFVVNTEEIVQFLKDHPSPAAQAEFFELLKAHDDAATIFESLDATSPGDRAVVSKAIDAAFDAGVLTAKDLLPVEQGGLLCAYNPPSDHAGLAAIIAATHDPALITAYANGEVALMTANPDYQATASRAGAVATALASLPPAELQKYLKAHPDQASWVIDHINDPAASGSDMDGGTALAALLKTVGKIKPPTRESIGLFEASLPMLGKSKAAREAAAQFFIDHKSVLLSDGPLGYISKNGAISVGKQAVLAELFANTLFSKPKPANADALRDSISATLKSLNDTLNANGDDDPSVAMKELARTLGSLVGTLESGFQVAVDRLNARNDAIDGAVDLFTSVAGVIPDLPFPGGGLIKDATVDQIAKWLKNGLHEEAADPNEAIPFHVLFGATLENGDLATNYDAARVETYINSHLGLA